MLYSLPTNDLLGKPLSEMEFRCAYLIAFGRTYESVAKQNCISWNTVNGYMRRVYAKLDDVLSSHDSIGLAEAWEKGYLDGTVRVLQAPASTHR
jgi:DNA-binding CsgD family transcriptional regulator